jgi:hypothetical protein
LGAIVDYADWNSACLLNIRNEMLHTTMYAKRNDALSSSVWNRGLYIGPPQTILFLPPSPQRWYFPLSRDTPKFTSHAPFLFLFCPCCMYFTLLSSISSSFFDFSPHPFTFPSVFSSTFSYFFPRMTLADAPCKIWGMKQRVIAKYCMWNVTMCTIFSMY